jgi:hypothetical protein
MYYCALRMKRPILSVGASATGACVLLSLAAAYGCSSSPSGSDAKDSGTGHDAGSSEAAPPGRDSGGTLDGGKVDGQAGGVFADCSLADGCVADCSPPADDPIATGKKDFDLYDGCILAGMKLAGMNEAWQGQLLKSQAYNESGITPVITTDDDTCGGQNCGIWAISAGTISGDSPPGPCGSSAKDPFTGEVDYSHSYGLFQETPACEGTFLSKSLPTGYTCTGTTKANNIPFGTDITFYCESATSLGSMTPNGVKGYINAVQKTTDPNYATSILNPAYQLYVYLDHTWALNFAAANSKVHGCTEVEQWYLSLGYWLTGDPSNSCTLSDQTGSGNGQEYVLTAIHDYETVLYGKPWPYPSP